MFFNVENFNESIRSQEWQDHSKRNIFGNIKNRVKDKQDNFTNKIYYFLQNCNLKGYSISTSMYLTSFLTGLVNYQFDNGVTCSLDSKFEDYQIYINIDKKYSTDKDLETCFGISLHLFGLTLVSNNNLHEFFTKSDDKQEFSRVKHWCLLGLRITNKGTLVSMGYKDDNTEILEFVKSVEYHICNNPLIFYFNVNKNINEKYEGCFRIELTAGDTYYKYSPLKSYLHIPGIRTFFGINYAVSNNYILNLGAILGIREIIPIFISIFKDYNFELRSYIVYGLCFKIFKNTY